MTPQPTDAICTPPTSRLFKSPKAWLVSKGIQAWQLAARHGWPASSVTHVVTYIGKLHPPDGVGTPEERAEWAAHDDWCFSQTYPVGVWVRYASIVGRKHYICRQAKPLLTSLESHTYARKIEEHCWTMYNVRYDEWQLFGIMLNGLVVPDSATYRHWLDRGGKYHVCSSCDAAGREKARRYIEDTYAVTWPRLFGGRHVERVYPAHYMGGEEFEPMEVRR